MCDRRPFKFIFLVIIIFTVLFAGGCGDDDDAGTNPDNPTVPVTVTDIDGNVYQTVTIGTQVWMAENLKVTHYRNGDPIPNVTDNVAWEGLNTGAYCEYANDANNVTTYGRLYNWFAINDSREIAPTGWHVPSVAEFQTLIDYLGGWQVAGGKMKETGTIHWVSPNTGATNESGFTALPGSGRFPNPNPWSNLGWYARFWSTTESVSGFALSLTLYKDSPGVANNDEYFSFDGFSVRCVKN